MSFPERETQAPHLFLLNQLEPRQRKFEARARVQSHLLLRHWANDIECAWCWPM